MTSTNRWLLLAAWLAVCSGLAAGKPARHGARESPIPFSFVENQAGDLSFDPRDYVPKPISEMVKSKGYPFEEHSVTTKDGYILGLHRIPYGVKPLASGPHAGPGEQSQSLSRPPILLIHAYLLSSVDFVINEAHESLGYMLADAGFDVWLANVRGNTYSRNHLTHKTNTKDFWNFSWPDMAEYDFPAWTDYILKQRNKEQLYVVCYSHGCLIAFTKLLKNDDVAKKVAVVFALAPIVRLVHMKGILGILATPVATYYNEYADAVLRFLGFQDLLCYSNNSLPMFCAHPLTKQLCRGILYMIYGMDETYIDYLGTVVSHKPAGTSIKNLVHLAQMVKTGEFKRFDFGSWQKNQRIYGCGRPPSYLIENLRTPVALFWGENDFLSAAKDMRYMIEKLGNNVISNNYFWNYGHPDFVHGKSTGLPIYNKIIQITAQYPIK